MGMSQSDIGNGATRLDAASISAHRADPSSFEVGISPHPPFGHLLPKEKGRLTKGGCVVSRSCHPTHQALRTTHLPYRASTFIAASNPLSVVGNILSSPMISRIIPVLWL